MSASEALKDYDRNGGVLPVSASEEAQNEQALRELQQMMQGISGGFK